MEGENEVEGENEEEGEKEVEGENEEEGENEVEGEKEREERENDDLSNVLCLSQWQLQTSEAAVPLTRHSTPQDQLLSSVFKQLPRSGEWRGRDNTIPLHCSARYKPTMTECHFY